ncbi:MAG: thioredoxin domain-containing protein [Candidatus Sungbacteria bacterium]|uniref:Thioredoxin domain-containing protein n=1 Tax=Candidatus Sungiibacteriota bacterium TaxID=2750080 RepID=A0A932QY26_9BACT|nr:thioredoxin domain-containing protein [Candidatus Sungbacteria bacterium]
MQPATRMLFGIISCLLLAVIFVYLPKHNARIEALLSDPESPAIGNPYGNPVRIVVFSDYHCGPCKALSTALEELARHDTHLRIIFKEYPILTENSMVAARSALAVHFARSGAYFPYHQVLMQMSASFTPEMLAELAEKDDVPRDVYAKALANPKVDEQIGKSVELAGRLRINAVPALVVGHQVIVGDSLDMIRAAIARERENMKNAPEKTQ